jgi:hypothetical protein
MLRSPPEVDDEVSKMVIFQHFIRLRVCDFFIDNVARHRLSGESRNPGMLFRRFALCLGEFMLLGSGFRRSDETGVYLFTASEADSLRSERHLTHAVRD